MDWSQARSFLEKIEPILMDAIHLQENNRYDKEKRYYKCLMEFFEYLLIDVYLRFLEQQNSVEHDQENTFFLQSYNELSKLKTNQAEISKTCTDNSKIRILVYEEAFQIGRFAVQNMGCLDRMVRLMRDDASEIEFLWFRHSVGQAMGCLCEILEEMTKLYSSITFESCLKYIHAQKGTSSAE